MEFHIKNIDCEFNKNACLICFTKSCTERKKCLLKGVTMFNKTGHFKTKYFCIH